MCGCGNPYCSCFRNGVQVGLQVGKKIGHDYGYAGGYIEGVKDGYKKGFEHGVKVGFAFGYEFGYDDRRKGLNSWPDRHKSYVEDVILHDPRSWEYKHFGPVIKIKRKPDLLSHCF